MTTPSTPAPGPAPSPHEGPASGRRLVSFWDGELGWLERLCLRSMLATGHRVTIYGYRGHVVEAGVDVADAASVVPAGSAVHGLLTVAGKDRWRRRARVVFSDIFRFELMRRGLGTWVDLDVLFLRPLALESPYVFGLETPGSINNAVLSLPQGTPLLNDLLAFVDRRPVLPPWARGRAYWEQRLRAAIGIPLGPEAMEWGIFGPKALTHFAGVHGLVGAAQPQHVFYPVPYAEATSLFDPAADLDRWLKPDTIAVHLWNNRIRDLKRAPVPGGCFMDRQLRALDMAATEPARRQDA